MLGLRELEAFHLRSLAENLDSLAQLCHSLLGHGRLLLVGFRVLLPHCLLVRNALPGVGQLRLHRLDLVVQLLADLLGIGNLRQELLNGLPFVGHLLFPVGNRPLAPAHVLIKQILLLNRLIPDLLLHLLQHSDNPPQRILLLTLHVIHRRLQRRNIAAGHGQRGDPPSPHDCRRPAGGGGTLGFGVGTRRCLKSFPSVGSFQGRPAPLLFLLGVRHGHTSTL
mmetsp:Transcript_94648/g.216515  ORF Transcript_94648/g.216515 Transcript_94648/m.216515 type:complete len:223 (-) Transcript_94648:7-675(-)